MIPYHTYPSFLGIFNTFGLMVGLGIIAGVWVMKRHLDANGEQGELVYGFALWVAIFGILGARLLWVVAHPEIYFEDFPGSVLEVFALWKGGLSFFGGFLAAIPIIIVWLRRYDTISVRTFLDGGTLGVVIGLAFGRIGCTSVGEHFGGQTDFFLGVHYLGGKLAEPTLGDVTIVEGMRFHNNSIYGFALLVILFVGLLVLRRRGVRPGVIAALGAISYGVGRFALDILRINDNRTLGLTGAQYLSIVLFCLGIWYLWHVLHTYEPTSRRKAPAEVVSGTAEEVTADATAD